MDTSSTTGLPYFDEATQKRFHENGFHGEIEGIAAKHERECGTVLLEEEQQQSKIAENLLAIRTKLHNLAEILELQTSINRLTNSLPRYQKMAERIRRTKKYDKIVRIGDAARENLERLKAEHIIKFFPEHMPEGMFYPKHTSEAAHICVVCGKHGEYRMSEHLLRAHSDVLQKDSIDFKVSSSTLHGNNTLEQLGRGITQYMGVPRIDLRLVRNKGQISRDRYVAHAEMNVEIQGLEERFRAPTEEERELEEESSPVVVEEAAPVLEEQIEVVGPSTLQATALEAFTPTPQRHDYTHVLATKASQAPPNLDLMFSYELDEQAVPDYYVEEYTVPVKRKHNRTGLQPFSLRYGDGEEILWIGSYPIPKGGTKAAQYKQPYYGQYFGQSWPRDMFRRRLQRTEGEETPRKRPRVSSPVKADTTEDSSLTLEEIVMEQGDIGALEPQASALESQASSPLPLKQFEQHPIGSSSGEGTSVQHIDIVDEQEAVEKIPVYKLKFHFKRQKSEACTANAELILSDLITMAVRRRVHVVRKSAVPASLLADLEKRFGPMDPSRHLQLLNSTSYTGGLTEVENVWQLSNFIHKCHAQPVQDFPWLEVREMPTIKGRGVFAKVDIAKGMAVADYR
ncbi:unnamed protein product [Cylicocyclus nassatus]|uniref:Uncharacterized protein n=1 Tax=Cylicocyclus nassatus TaxID=53992 RepID=A0AA36GP34_CYLNA|nr:unnamed protein product [Cylicocyclus nassatus]